MMTWIKRWLGRDSGLPEDERKRKEMDIKKGLHEAASRVHFLEVEAELKRRKHQEPDS